MCLGKRGAGPGAGLSTLLYFQKDENEGKRGGREREGEGGAALTAVTGSLASCVAEWLGEWDLLAWWNFTHLTSPAHTCRQRQQQAVSDIIEFLAYRAEMRCGGFWKSVGWILF
ncbi:hypothetical protein ONS96_014106 [Cadophora gregata f. sp. sojae]|nr:hypothetical protein ONS96_014106 [Cadophora gregata f. sp. sojae]